MKTNNNLGPVLLDGKQAACVYDSLVATGNNELASLIFSKSRLSGREQEFASFARLSLAGNLEVDELPVVSISEAGAFVMAWFWVDSSDVSQECVNH